MRTRILVAFMASSTLFGMAQCPTMTAGSDQFVCPNSTATLAATAPVGYTGIWRRTGGNNPLATITTPTSPTSTLGITTSGTINLIWTLTDSAAVNPSCITLRDTVRIVVQGNANAGNAVTACIGATVTLNATTPTSVATGTWSVVTAPVGATPLIASLSDPKSTVTGFSAAGAYTLRWKLASPTCTLASDSDDVNITINSAPSQAVISGPETLAVCQNSPLTQLVGSTPVTGNPTWSIVGGGGVVSFNGSSSNDTVRIAPGNGGIAALVYRIANVAGNTAANNPAFKCSTYDTLRVAVGPSNANAGPDQGYCASPLPAISLAATPVLSFETGTWSVASGTATVTTPSSPTSAVTGLAAAGTATLVWTVTVGTCVDTDTVRIITSAAPSVASVLMADTIICVGDTINLKGSTAVTGASSWLILQPNGNNIVRFVPQNGGNVGATVAARGRIAGTVKVYYVIAVGTADTGNACATYDSLQITVRTAPNADAGDNSVAVCGSNVVIQLEAEAPAAGETGLWSVIYGTATIARPSDSASTVTGITDSTVLRWTVSTGPGGCSASDDVEVVVNQAPTVATSLTADTTICLGATFTARGSTPIVGTASWSTMQNPAATVVSGGNTANAVIRGNAAGTIKLRYRIANGDNSITSGCASVDTLTLTVISGGACTSGLWDTYEKTANLAISPNPGNGFFLLSMPNGGNGTADITVSNMEGRQVYEEKSVSFSQKEIDLSAAPKGVYLVKISSGDKISTGRLIIQ